MKKVLLPFLLGVALTLSPLFFLQPTNKQFNPITPERKATHMITYLNEADEAKALCTGTAVGPHTLLTALHCDLGEETTIRLDLSQRKYHILAVATDGRDHILYRLDGPEFHNYVTIHERVAVLGEKVITYGDGLGDYPLHTHVGNVIADANGGDTSELDAADGARCFSLPTVPGDSGSAVYGEDGSIVALITFGKDESETSVGFALAFAPKVIEEAKQ